MTENLEQDLGPLTEDEAFQISQYRLIDVDHCNQRQLIALFNKKPKNVYFDSIRIFNGMKDRYVIMFLEEVNEWNSYHYIAQKTSSQALLSLLLNTTEFDNKTWPVIFVDNIRVELLPQLKNHPAPIIRKKVAEKIDESHLQSMMTDENAEVRTEVAKRIDINLLPLMMTDEWYPVRTEVANRIDPSFLPQMLPEEEHGVLLEIMRRIDPSYLVDMIDYGDYQVIDVIIERIDPGYLFYFLKHNTSNYRFKAAKRCDVEDLPPLLGDLSESVRVIAYKRIPAELVPKKYLKRWHERNVKMMMGL